MAEAEDLADVLAVPRLATENRMKGAKVRQAVRWAVRWMAHNLRLVTVALAICVVLALALSAVWMSYIFVALAGAGLLALTAFGVLALRRSRRLRREITRVRRSLGRLHDRTSHLQSDDARRAAEVARLSTELGQQAAAVGVLQARLGELTAEVARLRSENLRQMEAASQRILGLYASLDRLCWAPPGVAQGVGQDLLDADQVLDAYRVFDEFVGLDNVPPAILGRLRAGLRPRGYLSYELRAQQALLRKSDSKSGREILARIEGETALYQGTCSPLVKPRPANFVPRPSRVLHVVAHARPVTQSGYTVRTHYTVLAQREAGLDPYVAIQPTAELAEGESTAIELVDGVPYHFLAGQSKGRLRWDEWFERFVAELVLLVRRIQPSVLHAASDFINARAALLVGKAFRIPVVYESRGFWEETWLSRKSVEFGWTDLSTIERRFGLPDEYIWRREAEDQARREADAVVTLGAAMADRIVAGGGVLAERVHVIPNAADPKIFRPATRDEALGEAIGLKAESVVVGYISSLVEYEGIDILIRSFATARRSCDSPMQLLIVGEGYSRASLMNLANTLGVAEAVIFTGNIPHDDVLAYYGLIDIFVVPRRPVAVTNLVSPLKPYEAMATGRAMVVSDVTALRDLAQESGAVRTFAAGDPDDLARTIVELANNPSERQRLGAEADAWARGTRTWARNGLLYLDLYRRLGVVGDVEAALGGLSAADIDTVELRRALRELPQLPFELIDAGQPLSRADQIMDEGWTLGNHPMIPISPGTAWWLQTRHDRSLDFNLHSWDFVIPVLRQWEKTRERRYLDWALHRALEWLEEFSTGAGADGMAWYDMALGMRAYRLAYLVSEVARQDYDDDVFVRLLPGVFRHQRELYRAEAFSPTSNHGFYVAAGEAAFARRLSPMPLMAKLQEQADERLGIMLDRQLASDGGHLEHSPDYHRMVTNSYLALIRDGLLTGESVVERVRRADQITDWFVLPDGHLLQFGDSPAKIGPRQGSSRISPTHRSHGVPKSAPTLLVLPESGFVIVRELSGAGAKGRGSCYLAVQAGFHSRTHKHADDLSFVWYDHDHEVLIDAGRYGYGDLLPPESPLRQEGFFYASAERQYVESTPAHNTVTVDGRDHVRRRAPFGSAVVDAEERDGWYRIRARAPQVGWIHEREWLLRPGRLLLLTDTMTPEDDNGHNYQSWLNFPEEAKVVTDASGLKVSFAGSATLWVVSLDDFAPMPPLRAEQDPMRGWRSRVDGELTPAWSTGFGKHARSTQVSRLLFSFGDRLSSADFDTPFAMPTR